jgi:hypothetical protein
MELFLVQETKMAKFYTLHSAAGLIRSNKFDDKGDAICMGSFRAEYLNFPVKIYEHTEDLEQTCILVCNVDGSVEKPKGMGSEVQDLGNLAGVPNRQAANILLSAFDEEPLTSFRLKGNISESQVADLEKAVGCDIGMVTENSFNAFTQDPKKVHQIETKLSEWSLELDDVMEASLKRNKTHAAIEASEVIEQEAEIVTAARKAHLAARANRLPELRVRASMKFGGGHKFVAHCETMDAQGKKAPRIAVHVDGSKVGEAKDEREASRIIADHAERSFSKFIKKELA